MPLQCSRTLIQTTTAAFVAAIAPASLAGDCPDEFTPACPRWEVIETKVPPGFCGGFPPQFQVRDIDDRGVVVGSLRCGSSRHAAIWIPGEEIRRIEMPDGTIESDAVGIDAKGRIAGDLINSDSETFGWILDGDEFTLIPVADGFAEIRVEGMALDGSIAGNMIGGPPSFVFRWSDGAFDFLPAPIVGTNTTVLGMTDDGALYGRMSNWKPGVTAPVIVEGNEWKILPMPPDAIFGEVRDAETADLATGRVAFPEGVGATTIWNGDQLDVVFGDLDGPVGMSPSAIDYDGVVHAGDFTPDESDPKWMLVDGSIVATLQDLIAGLPADAEPVTWYTRGPLAIGQSLRANPNGRVIWRAMRVPGVPGDIDCDGRTGFEDLLAVVSAWSCEQSARADLDLDGVVGASDLMIVINGWNRPSGG
ncbi:MAG: hypothetical protein AB8G96_13320 [Phycisphaerales bacterium]